MRRRRGSIRWWSSSPTSRQRRCPPYHLLRSPTTRPPLSRELPVGVLLELDPTAPASLEQRLVAYLHERRAAGFAALCAVLPAGDAVASRVPAVVCTAAEAERLPALLGELCQCPLLVRAISRLLPFDRRASGPRGVVKHVTEMLPAHGEGAAVRVVARPRALESRVCAAFEPGLLAPARFTHTLCVATSAGSGDVKAKREEDDDLALRFSLLPRAVFDLPAWTSARKTDVGSRTYWRYLEVASRWAHRLEGATSAAVWTDEPEPVPWLGTWADRFVAPGAHIAELRLSASAQSVDVSAIRGSWARPGGASASVLLSDVRFGGEELVDMLQALLRLAAVAGGTARVAEAEGAAPPLLAPYGVALLTLCCGRKPRSLKRWHREMARSIEAKLGIRHVELLHLLGDREQERTAVLRWDIDAMPLPPSIPDALPKEGGTFCE